jgi:hypothetical protein
MYGFYFLVFIFFTMLRIKPMASHMLGKHSATEMHAQPLSVKVFIEYPSLFLCTLCSLSLETSHLTSSHTVA